MPPLKKAPTKAAPKHNEMKDLRRAYEHLGRVEILQRALGEDEPDVSTLVALAQRELKAGHASDAADLLRAAEHISFAALASAVGRSSQMVPKLTEALQNEFDHLIEKAEEHWADEDESNRHPEVLALYRRAFDAAKKAHKQGSFRKALELARGAEALAHVKMHGRDGLSGGKDHLRLATS